MTKAQLQEVQGLLHSYAAELTYLDTYEPSEQNTAELALCVKARKNVEREISDVERLEAITSAGH